MSNIKSKLSKEQFIEFEFIVFTHDEYIEICKIHSFAKSAFIEKNSPDFKKYYIPIRYPSVEEFMIIVNFWIKC